MRDRVLNIAHLLEASGRRFPEMPAVSTGLNLLCTYKGLAERVSRLAHGLRTLSGVESGSRVAVVMGNCPEYIEVLWAIWWAGLCAVPVNAKLHEREIEFILRDTGATICLATSNQAEAMMALGGKISDLRHVIDVSAGSYQELHAGYGMRFAETGEDTPAWIFYTSGTTGRPKGAVLTHRNLMAMSLRYYCDIDHVVAGDSALMAAPMSHASGLMCIPHVGRAGHCVVPESGGFDVDELFGLVEAHTNVSFFAAPTMLVRMVNHPRSALVPWTHVKTILYGGAPMYRADLERAVACMGPCLVQGYGQGETPITITFLDRAAHVDRDHPEYEERISSVGCARTGVEVKIVDAQGRELPNGELGEVVVRSEVTMSGYWCNEAATRAAIRDGWLYTGDIGSLSPHGYLALRDRSKDLIISGGSNIYPREVEEVLLTHPSVVECAVVGCPSSQWGEEVVAFVVANPGVEGLDSVLDAWCLDHIARFKRPKRYIYLEQLPKSSYGKVLKSELRARLVQAGAGNV